MKKNYLFLFMLLFLALSPLASTTDTSTMPSETPLNLQTQENYSDNSNLSPQNWSEPQQPFLEQSNPWESLRNWIDEGLRGLDESTESLMMLENQLSELRAETREQESLLRQSQELLTSLRQSLDDALRAIDVAVDRMEDAEAYAWWIDARNELLRQQAQKARRSAGIGFTVGGVSFGAGVPLVVEGLRQDNKTMTLAGAGVAVIPGVIWALGHWAFGWW